MIAARIDHDLHPASFRRRPLSPSLTRIREHTVSRGVSVPLKIELKPGERVILGDCIVTNDNRRTRLMIDGAVPILRDKDIMTARRANSPAKRIYLAVQRMYTAKRPREDFANYLRLTRETLAAMPDMRPFIDSINNRILTGDLYKALKEAGKLIAYEKDRLTMNNAAMAYAKVAKETASPRELEAALLLKAAAKLQAVHDSWPQKPAEFKDALLYNRRLWTVFLDSVNRDDNKLPKPIRSNLVQLGMFVMNETFAAMTKPTLNQLKAMIKVNRGIAAGLRGRA
jgi:flagellar biosynthesis repressor protein FlbT